MPAHQRKSCGDLHVEDADHHKIHPDAAVAALASRQRGVVTTAQLRAVGLGRGAVASRVASGRLHRLHKGVYLVGHRALAPLARETAALLACGAGAVLSHRSAAAVWGFSEAPRGRVEVTVVGRDCGARPGIRHYRVSSLDRADRRRRHGLTLTGPARTLVDIASAVGDRSLERAVDQALVLRLTTHDELRAAISRSRGRPGTHALRALLERADGPGFARSEAERRLAELLREHGLPAPERNAVVGPYEVDMLWRSQRLVVEVDGYAFHSTRAAFERDRARDADLQARGLRVARFTWRQISERPAVVVARVGRLLER